MKKTLTKRKMYQKRRKKEKEEKRRIQKQQAAIKGLTMAPRTANNNKFNNNKNHQQQQSFNTINMTTVNRNPPNQQGIDHQLHIPHPQYPNTASNSYTERMRQWWQTYCTAIQYHNEQRQQWRAMCSNEESPTETYAELLKRYAAQYETSSDEDDEEEYLDTTNQVESGEHTTTHHEDGQDDDVDVEYLKFLEITYKHREELRLKREAEKMS